MKLFVPPAPRTNRFTPTGCRRLLLYLSLTLAFFLTTACSPFVGLPQGGEPSISVPQETPLPTVTPLPPTPTIVWFPPTATPTPFPTRAVTPTLDPHPVVGEQIFADDFSSAGLWSLSQSSLGSVARGKQELTIAIPAVAGKEYLYSVRSEPVLTDFYAEITASPTLCRGYDEYGILVRYNSAQDYYRFSLSCNGHTRLDRISQGQATSPQSWVLSGGVPPGAPSVSRLGVWAKGKEMRFYANNLFLFSISDPLMPSGTLGVFARSVDDNAVTVNFSDLQVYSISP